MTMYQYTHYLLFQIAKFIVTSNPYDIVSLFVNP